MKMLFTSNVHETIDTRFYVAENKKNSKLIFIQFGGFPRIGSHMTLLGAFKSLLHDFPVGTAAWEGSENFSMLFFESHLINLTNIV